jgi:hypothetical protein
MSLNYEYKQFGRKKKEHVEKEVIIFKNEAEKVAWRIEQMAKNPVCEGVVVVVVGGGVVVVVVGGVVVVVVVVVVVAVAVAVAVAVVVFVVDVAVVDVAVVVNIVFMVHTATSSSVPCVRDSMNAHLTRRLDIYPHDAILACTKERDAPRRGMKGTEPWSSLFLC